MGLTEADAHLMALKQCIILGRQRISDCILDLENVRDLRDLRTVQDQITDVILSLKYTIDFILGDPSP